MRDTVPKCTKAPLSKTTVIPLHSDMYASYSGRHLPEASGALGSGGLERSEVDLG